MKRSVATAHKGHNRRDWAPFLRDTTLFDSNHPPRGIYVLRRGTVQLSSDSGVILDYLGTGDFFGEKMLLPGLRSAQIATTVSPAQIQSLGKRGFLDRVHRDRRFALRVLKNLVARIDRQEQSIRELAREPVARRLALVLFRLLPNRPASGWVRLSWNPTNPELARRIGSTRWRISRLVTHFSRLGWLRRENGLRVHREGLDAFLQSTQHRP